MELMQRRRAMLAAGKKPRLPREYQEVEYLKSTGTQYINTIVYASNLNKITAVFRADDLNQSRCYVFGAVKSDGTDRNQFTYIFIYNNTPKVNCGWGNKSYTANIVHTTAKHTISVNAGTFILDGVQIEQISSNAFYGLTPIALFGCFIDNSIVSMDKLSIYSATIDNGANRLRDMVPCRRKSDNKPGMYDLTGSICPLTNSPFYINAGTDDFLVGPDVN